MVFIPRDPVMQNQFLVHDSSKGTTATAGAVVSLSASEKVEVVSGTNTAPYGFLMQNVKAESVAHPTGFRLPGDLGSSDAFTGDPVGVAHLGLYDTTFYDTSGTFTAGGLLGVTAEGKVTPSGSGNDLSVGNVGVAQNSLDATAVAAGSSLRVKLLV
jgi:hypothetical protein